MSLLVTSCTMDKQPDRLLNKGPQYLRTRTNPGLFGQDKKSAVELLAASKSQFYSSKTSVLLDKQQDLAVSVGQHERFSSKSNNKNKNNPPRSKSEFDLSLSQFTPADDESDENNNDTSDDSINISKADVFENTTPLNLQQDNRINHRSTPEVKGLVTVLNSSTKKEESYTAPIAASPESRAVNHSSKSQPRLTILRSSSSPAAENEQIYENVAALHTPQVVSDEVDCTIIKKPIPVPRKSKEKPIPPPRKLSLKSPTDTTSKDPSLCLKGFTSPLTVHSPSVPNTLAIKETPHLKTQTSLPDSETDSREKRLVVESLTKQFTALTATSRPLVPEKPHLLPKPAKSPELKSTSEVSGTFTATPIFIGKTGSSNEQFHARRVYITDDCVSGCITPSKHSILEKLYASNSNVTVNRGRKRCPDVSASARAIKRERRSTGSDISFAKPGFVNSLISTFVPLENNSSSTPKSEMSAESADQAACESEVNAIPAASMEAENIHGPDVWAREVTRSNSCLSGKMEPHDASPISISPTPQCSLVPRSHSDIGCCLESQHSRDSSLVSSHSRLSRASVGADLEHFFNQMGLEKGVLEPMNRLRELQTGEVFDSISSFDSQDAVSIYSRSEQEWSDAQSMDRSLQQTSIVERNARIIKWLCNVRKAKSQSQKPTNTATGKT